MNAARPFAETRLAAYLTKRILELKGKKTQAQIATEAGFTSANMISILKVGSTRLPLDRVAQLAIALEADPAYLMLMALEQASGDTHAKAMVDIFGGVVTRNEMTIILAVREASDMTDPPLTRRGRAAIQAAFGK